MKNLKILFIDDDEIERMKFKRICNKSRFKTSILEAKNGEEALRIVSDDIPHLIILDLNMPKMNGIEFLSHLKSNRNLIYIPIVVLSSSDNKEDIKKCFEIGVAGYMIKPLHYEDYEQRILNILSYWTNNELIK